MGHEPALLIVVSGPSGAGKGTLCQVLLKEREDLVYSISATTRQMRPGEKDGESYFFLEKERFREMIEAEGFLEWAEVYGNFYGTPRQAVEGNLRGGKDVLLEIDIQGALKVKKIFPEGVFVFIVPPSLGELKRRITRRGTENEESISRRLASAGRELAYISQYDYVVINDNLEEAAGKLKAIIVAEKCRPARQVFPFSQEKGGIE